MKVAEYFQNGEISIDHFLLEKVVRAKEELAKVQIKVVKINDVIIQKLRQDFAGQSEVFCRRMAEANVNILVQ